MTSNNLDKLECRSPMWAEMSSSKQAFTKTKSQKITIPMRDLNGAMFRRGHYTYDCNNGRGHHYKGSAHDHIIDIKTTQHGQKRVVHATLENAQGYQTIDLSFKNIDGQCTLIDGRLEKNGVIASPNDPQHLSDALLSIYKHVRLCADPKWATEYLMEKEAREVAAQIMTLESFPKIINNNGELQFTAPLRGACGKICGQGACPAKAMMRRL